MQVPRATPRYRLCPRCKGPVYRRLRYDAKLRRYVEVDVCPVCEREAAP
ncbi:MAG: hypothetical protein IT345_08785 [Trueperaceae bacterium]|nr:hypothetical protein [Trueperaceae bacterium]